MIVLRNRRGGPWKQPPERHAFRIAGHDVVSDVPFAELAAFAAAAPSDVPLPPALGGDCGPADRGDEVFRGAAFLCGSTREVVCTSTLRGHELSVAGVGEFVVTPGGTQVLCTAGAAGLPDAALAEAVLGPALTLALAMQGTFCLHGSGVLSGAGALLFLGPSGTGKSTLAAHLAAAGGAFTPLTDDVTPVVLSPSGVEVRPRFPQLKLPADRQPAHDAAERVRLRAAYLLELPESGAADEVSVEGLDQSRGLAALVRHTVAVRLFGRDLLATYLEAIAGAPSLPVRRLRYPRRYEALPGVFACVAADLERLRGE